MATYVGDALYTHAAGGCYVCHRGDSLVNTDTVIQGEGVLALCKGCIQDMAEAADLTLNAAAIAEIQAQHDFERRRFNEAAVAVLEARVAELEEDLAKAQEFDSKVDSILEDIRKAAKPATTRKPAARPKAPVK